MPSRATNRERTLATFLFDNGRDHVFGHSSNDDGAPNNQSGRANETEYPRDSLWLINNFLSIEHAQQHY